MRITHARKWSTCMAGAALAIGMLWPVGQAAAASSSAVTAQHQTDGTVAPTDPTNLHTYFHTSSMIGLLWNKPLDGGQVASYAIYQDGHRMASVSKTQYGTLNTDYTVRGLAADHAYTFQITAIDATGHPLGTTRSVTVRTARAGRTLNVLNFGAVGDGKTLDTKALQRAIDACPTDGIVEVPKGTYLTGPLFLKSNMTLYLDKGATLLGSQNRADYPVIQSRWEGTNMKSYASLITAIRAHNVVIAGDGTLNGNADANIWWDKAEKEPKNGGPARPRTVEIIRSTNVVLQGLTIENSPAWTIHPLYSQDVVISGVTVHNPPDAQNTDGLDPDSTQYLTVVDDVFDVGDDDIAIKSGKDSEGRRIGIPSEHILIKDCLMLHGHGGVTIGSEMSGGVKDVLVQNCVFNGTQVGLRLKTLRGRGGVVENLTFDGVQMNHIKDQAFLIDENYGSNGSALPSGPVTDATPAIRNLNFDNITVNGAKQAVFFNGLQELPIQYITFHNVRITADKGILTNNVQNIRLDHVTMNGVPLFDGPNSIADLAYTGALDGTVNLTANSAPIALPGGLVNNLGGTVSVWERTGSADSGGSGSIFFGEGAAAANGVELGFNSTHQLQFAMTADAQAFSLTSPKAYNDGQWHKVTATWDSEGNATLYVDGSPVATQSSAPAAAVNGDPTVAEATLTPVSIADKAVVGQNAHGGNAFIGQLKDLQIYNYALPQMVVAGYQVSNLHGPAVVAPTGLTVDAVQYKDGTQTFTWVPPVLEGDTYLQPTASSASGPSGNRLSFDLHQAATVYVAYPANLHAPSWLNEFQPTGLMLQNSDGQTFSLYSKDFAAGTVTLGDTGTAHRVPPYTVIMGQGLPTSNGVS